MMVISNFRRHIGEVGGVFVLQDGVPYARVLHHLLALLGR
jgi:hypothetical protein